MKKYRLKRFASTNNNVRGGECVGVFLQPPTEGESFTIFESVKDQLPDIHGRVVTTSRITKLMKIKNGWQFRTLNSVYSLIEVEE